jgi:DNA-binding Lrp family transcriptional regulator
MTEEDGLDHTAAIDEPDRRIVAATQAGLPLVPEPYREVAGEVGLSEDEVLRRMNRLNALGIIRRVGVVPNHYALGYRANGMTVWDVEDARVSDLGQVVGGLDFVTHCYRRPRHPPRWPYNLFAMVHGRDRSEVEEKAERIASVLGSASRGHDILYSTEILKKTGLRLRRDRKE